MEWFNIVVCLYNSDPGAEVCDPPRVGHAQVKFIVVQQPGTKKIYTG